MKSVITATLIITCILITTLPAQSEFSVDDYALYLQENQNFSYERLILLICNSYFKSFHRIAI